MDVTSSPADATVWWSCSDCDVDVELPATETAGFQLPCPDCPGSLSESWRWDAAA